MKKFYIFTLTLFVSLQVSSQVYWSKHATPVLEKGPDGSWEENGVGFPSVLLKDDTLHMWYAGLNDEYLAIGHAFSTDDGLTWTKNAQNPVLSPGPSGSFDEQRAYVPKVIYHAGLFHMWYLGAKDNLETLGYATSPDGSNWTKDPSNPVANTGTGPVLFKDELFHIWFTYKSGNSYLTGYATSPDGKTWTQNDKKPVLPAGSISDWDYPRIQAQSVIFKANTFHLFYSGGKLYEWQEGYATSEDGVNWTKYASNPVLPRDSESAWDKDYTSFSSVIFDEAESKWKMWYYGGGAFAGGSIGYAETPPVSINNQISINGVSVFPNPVSDILQVHSGTASPVTVEIFNLTGKLAYSCKTHESTTCIDVSILEKGIYIIRFSKKGAVEIKKIVKF